MKNRTFARLSLLIPPGIWVISLLLLIAGFAFFPDFLTSSETPAPVGAVELLILFYVIGIVYWILPYLVLSLTLLLISFIVTEKVLKVAYLFSPILMTSMIMTVVVVTTIIPVVGSLLIDYFPSTFQDSGLTDALYVIVVLYAILELIAIVALIWGYICLGLGFVAYKLLQQFGMIKVEEKINPKIIAVRSQQVQQELK
jgi:hypothetical protein